MPKHPGSTTYKAYVHLELRGITYLEVKFDIHVFIDAMLLMRETKRVTRVSNQVKVLVFIIFILSIPYI